MVNVSYGDLVMCALRSGLNCTEHACCESPSCQKTRINHISWHLEIMSYNGDLNIVTWSQKWTSDTL